MPVRPVQVFQVAGRRLTAGPVLAVLTDGPGDPAVARAAARLTAASGHLLVAAAAVPVPFGDAPPDAARIRTGAVAVVARVAPALATAGVAWTRTTLPVAAGTDPARFLDASAVCRLADRYGAVAVVCAAPLHDPAGRLRPVRTAHLAAAAGPR